MVLGGKSGERGVNGVQTPEPLISIAMCTYNGARFVVEQLDSILQQSYSNLEIVIGDDASTDETVAILRRYQADDPRIRLLESERNLGFVRNFERVMSACTGELIALADQDDIWFPDKILTLYREMGAAQLIYSRVQVVNEAGEPLDREFPKVRRLEGRCALSLVFDNCVTGHACLIRRELLAQALPFPASVKVHDQWLAIAAAASGQLKASQQVLSYYRQHDNNVILGNRTRRKESRYRQKQLRDDKHVALMEAMIQSGMLEAGEVALLEECSRLLRRNSRVFYNARLAAFLRGRGSVFLCLFRNPDKVRSKLCRGSWFLRLLPFA